jgi:hypothetical protein
MYTMLSSYMIIGNIFLVDKSQVSNIPQIVDFIQTHFQLVYNVGLFKINAETAPKLIEPILTVLNRTYVSYTVY